MATKRKPVRKKPEEQETPVLIDDKTSIVGYDKVRYEQRGLDEFTVTLQNGETLVVLGHDISLDTGGTDDTKLPIYQIFEYVPVDAEVQHQKTYNDGPIWNPESIETRIETSLSKQYIQVVKAILWPGEWICVTRELGE